MVGSGGEEENRPFAVGRGPADVSNLNFSVGRAGVRCSRGVPKMAWGPSAKAKAVEVADSLLEKTAGVSLSCWWFGAFTTTDDWLVEGIFVLIGWQF